MRLSKIRISEINIYSETEREWSQGNWYRETIHDNNSKWKRGVFAELTPGARSNSNV